MRHILPLEPRENARRLLERCKRLIHDCTRKPAFLVDGDRTLTSGDTSRTFLERAGGDPAAIKASFERHGYCFESFRFHAEMHLALGRDAFRHFAPLVARQTLLYPGAVDFLCHASARGRVIVVTAGIPAIWREILALHRLDEIEVIGGIDHETPLVLGVEEKGIVARQIARVASRVVGVGDSEIDAEMLHACDHAVVVLNNRRSCELLRQVRSHKSLSHIAPHGVPLDDVPLTDWIDLVPLALRASA